MADLSLKNVGHAASAQHAGSEYHLPKYIIWLCQKHTYVYLLLVVNKQTNKKWDRKMLQILAMKEKSQITHSSVLYFMCNYLNTTEYINCALHSLMSSEK